MRDMGAMALILAGLCVVIFDRYWRDGRGAADAGRGSYEAVGMEADDDDVDDDGARSTMSKVSRAPSVAPSLHPSMAGSVRSMACSEVTVGAGDRTECA